MVALSSTPSHPRPPSGIARPKLSPKYRASTIDRCLTRPRRFVPVGVSGRRMSYSQSPSSFESIASRTDRRLLCRLDFASAYSGSWCGHGPDRTSRFLLSPSITGQYYASVRPQLPPIQAQIISYVELAGWPWAAGFWEELTKPPGQPSHAGALGVVPARQIVK